MLKMDLKSKGITWVGNIYQKFEAVCQEVDDIVSQDAVNYVENQVLNVGDSVKKLYSDVVQELFPPFVNSVKHGSCSVALKNNTDSSFGSGAGIKGNEKGAGENPVNSNIKLSHESNAFNPVNNQQADAFIGLDLINQVNDQTSSNSLEVEDCYLLQEEVVENDSRETSDAMKESLHVSIEQNAVKFTPQPLNLTSLNEKDPLKSSIFSESPSYYYENGCEVLAGAKVNTEQNSSLDVEENSMTSYTPQVLDFMSLGERESFEASFISESSDGVDENKCGIPAEVISESSDGVDENKCGIPAEVSHSTSVGNMKSPSSPKAGTINDSVAAWDQCISDGSEFSDSSVSSEVANSTVSRERSIMRMEPSSFNSSLISDNLSAKSDGSYFLKTESCKNKSIDVFDSSMVLVSCAPTHAVAGQSMASLARLVSCGSSQPIELNDGETSGINVALSLNKSSGITQGPICSAQDSAIISLSDIDVSLVNSIESSMEDVQLSDEAKLEESCVFVDDSELYAVSYRAQRLRSYKKRIRDAFAPKKRLAKEYEQLAIWYGDTGLEPSQGSSQTRLPFNFRISSESKNLQVQHACETEWELL